MITALFILSALLVAVYVGVTIVRNGIPDSISAMVYHFPEKSQWLWTVWLSAVGLTLLPGLLDVLPDGWECLGFMTVACVVGAAVTPLVQKETRHWHNALGIMAGVLSQACVAVICPWMLVIWIPMLVMVMGGLAGYNDKRDDEPLPFGGKGVFVLEMICFVSLYITINIV